jgi:hypothetical protein
MLKYGSKEKNNRRRIGKKGEREQGKYKNGMGILGM